jgi:outer membrane protein assembly factor BamB
MLFSAKHPSAARCLRTAARGAALALAAAILSTGAQAQWTQGGFDAGRTNANTAESLLKRRNVDELTVRWGRPLDSYVVSQASQAGGRLFACGDSTGLFALSPSTGELLWQRQAPRLGNCSIPALADGVVYVGTSDWYHDIHRMYAYDQASGDLLWSTPLTGSDPNFGILPATAVDEQRLYVNMPFRRLIALNRADGSVAWELTTNQDWSDVGGFSVGLGRVFIAGSYFRDTIVASVQAYDAQTGARLWTSTFRDENIYVPPLVLGGQIHVFTNRGRLVTLDPATGQQLASVQLEGGGGYTDLAGHDDRVFAVTGNKQLHVIDMTTHQVLWSLKAGQGVKIASRNVVWANHQLYVTTEDRSNQKGLFVVRAADGRTAAWLPFADEAFGVPSLSVVDGRVIISAYGRLTAYGL